MIYFVDIDKTICELKDKDSTIRDYTNCIPLVDNIRKINKLYLQGHTIVYWTARGMKTGQTAELYGLTISQLVAWGCLYHELRMGKPMYDYIIDDKALRIEELE